MIKAGLIFAGKVRAIFPDTTGEGEAETVVEELQRKGIYASVIFIPEFETSEDFLVTLATLQYEDRKDDIMDTLVVERLSKNRYRLLDGFNRFGCVPYNTKVPCHIMGEEGCHMIPKKQISTARRRK